jgi:hypothetical protein
VCTIPPDELTFTYHPFEKPIVIRPPVRSLEPMVTSLRGRMHVSWSSPSGPFYLTWAVEDDMTDMYSREPQARLQIATMMADAYERSLHRRRDQL